jgi:hypothetical protein
VHPTKWSGFAAGLLLAVWGSAVPAAAQCALCYTSAAATGERGAAVLRLGILVLLIPTLLTFAGVLLLTLRGLKRRELSFLDESEQVELLPLPTPQDQRAPSAL